MQMQVLFLCFLTAIPSRAQVANNTSLVGTVTDANGAVMGVKAAGGQPQVGVIAMFTKSGILELHGAMHECLEILLRHVGTVPVNLLSEPLAGFGFPTVWKQLTHILTVEEGWVHDLQDKSFAGWGDEARPTITALLAAKSRLRDATRVYVESLSEAQLNAPLAKRPQAWFGELRSPAFILLHVITHAFHHKGQVVAMLRTLGHPAPDTDLQRG